MFPVWNLRLLMLPHWPSRSYAQVTASGATVVLGGQQLPDAPARQALQAIHPAANRIAAESHAVGDSVS